MTQIFTLLILLLTFLIGAKPCTFNGLAGNSPTQACTIRETLGAANKKLKAHKGNKLAPHLNRLLIYGQKGNGKTTLSEAIVIESDSYEVVVNGTHINHPDPLVNAQRIKQLFEKTLDEARKQERVGVIIIDEIEFMDESGFGELRRQLDVHEDTRDLFFMCTTNKIGSIEDSFIDRFGPHNIKIENPGADRRYLLATHFSVVYNKELKCRALKHIAERTDKCSIREIKDVLLSVTRNEQGDVDEQDLTQAILDSKKKSNDHKDANTDRRQQVREALTDIRLIGGAASAVGLTALLSNETVRKKAQSAAKGAGDRVARAVSPYAEKLGEALVGVLNSVSGK